MKQHQKQRAQEPISGNDIAKYLGANSDFAFELQVRNALFELGYRTEHAGTYTDTVTGKSRQFDIRACHLHPCIEFCLAVECKRLTPQNPLILLTVPRKNKKDYLQVLRPRHDPHATPPIYGDITEVRPRIGCNTPYRASEPVAKDTLQIRRQKGSLCADDRDVYEKWAQAISSAYDLVAWGGRMDVAGPERNELDAAVVLPVLVVPDKTLWTVHFSDSPPFRAGPPGQVDRCPMLVEHEVPVSDPCRGYSYVMSHLEFVTIGGLQTLHTQLNAAFA